MERAEGTVAPILWAGLNLLMQADNLMVEVLGADRKRKDLA